MAIVLEANYAKKLGLPNYSSHQYCVTIRTELTDLSQVEAESAKLYALLQDAVDREIQNVGFMPDASTYGMNNHGPGNGNGHPCNGNGHHPPANGSERRAPVPAGDGWNCTEGQKGLSNSGAASCRRSSGCSCGFPGWSRSARFAFVFFSFAAERRIFFLPEFSRGKEARSQPW